MHVASLSTLVFFPCGLLLLAPVYINYTYPPSIWQSSVSALVRRNNAGGIMYARDSRPGQAKRCYGVIQRTGLPGVTSLF